LFTAKIKTAGFAATFLQTKGFDPGVKLSVNWK
jgi:hypothetical protein